MSNTGRSILGTHMLDLLSRGDIEVATFGNQSNITNVRIYDNDDPANGYIISKNSNVLALLKESGNTQIGIGTTAVDPSANLQVQGTIYTSNIGTYNPDGTLYFNGQTLSGVTNVNYSGELIKNGTAITTPPPQSLTAIRQTTIISSDTQDTFTISQKGAIDSRIDTMEVFVNGIKYPYIPDDSYYSLSYTYDGTNTIFTVVLAFPAVEYDVVDIVLWPGKDLWSVRQTVVATQSTDTIVFTAPGSNLTYMKDIEFYVNGLKYPYISDTESDYHMTSTYDGSITTYTFVLAGNVNEGDVVDITMWYNKARENVLHTTFITLQDQIDFNFTTAGVVSAFAKNIEVYIDGRKLSYINPTLSDYTCFYSFDGSDTNIVVLLATFPPLADSFVEITVWLGDGAGNAALGSQWSGLSPISYIGGNVGIGVTSPNDLLEVGGGITSERVTVVQNTNGGDALVVGYQNSDPTMVVSASSVLTRQNGMVSIKSGTGNVVRELTGDSWVGFNLTWTNANTVTDLQSFRILAKLQLSGSGLVGNKQIDIFINPAELNEDAVTTVYSYSYANNMLASALTHTVTKTTYDSADIAFSWNSFVAPYNAMVSIEVQTHDCFSSFIVTPIY